MKQSANVTQGVSTSSLPHCKTPKLMLHGYIYTCNNFMWIRGSCDLENLFPQVNNVKRDQRKILNVSRATDQTSFAMP